MNNMKHTVYLPDAKFKVGDVIRRPNYNNEYCIYLHIYGRRAEGGFTILTFEGDGETKSLLNIEHDSYECSVQEGSAHDVKDATNEIRPGTIFAYYDREELEAISEVVQWDKPIVEHDTPDNVFQRDFDWKALHKQTDVVVVVVVPN